MANYFIKLDDSPEVRRKILEASKGGIHLLKAYQEIVVIRSQKLSLMNQLRKDLKELTILVNRAESLLPILSDKELQQLVPKELPKLEAKVEKKKAVKKQEPAPVMSEKERLEAALRKVEEQLSSL